VDDCLRVICSVWVSGTTEGKVGHAFGWTHRCVPNNNGEPVCRSRARKVALLANSHFVLVAGDKSVDLDRNLT